MPQYAVLCARCKYFYIEKSGFTCVAFPKGIPKEIIMGGFVHTSPFPGDNDIQFEEIE